MRHWGYPVDMDRRKELVQRAYQETAAAFAAARRRGGAEAPWLERFMLALPAGASVVDLGCGNGEPIARTLAAAGFAVTGVDFSPEQVRRASAHVPSGRFVVADMATVELEAGGFGGVIAWDSVFHPGRYTWHAWEGVVACADASQTRYRHKDQCVSSCQIASAIHDCAHSPGEFGECKIRQFTAIIYTKSLALWLIDDYTSAHGSKRKCSCGINGTGVFNCRKEYVVSCGNWIVRSFRCNCNI